LFKTGKKGQGNHQKWKYRFNPQNSRLTVRDGDSTGQNIDLSVKTKDFKQ